MTTTQKFLIAFFTVWSVVSLAGPRIQNAANYFHNIREDIAWFETAERSLPPDDRRQLFLRIYHSVTLEMPNMFAEKQFHHPEWVNALMLKYVSLYRNALDCELTSQCEVSPAWQVAFSENQRGRITPAGQLLISISAHVNRDLPVALASIPTTRFEDPTYKADFERISLIFQRRMPVLIKLVQHYETCHINRLDEKIIRRVIQFAIGRTRDKSWNWGAKLAQVKSSAEESNMMLQIEKHAHLENRSIYIFSPAPAFAICL